MELLPRYARPVVTLADVAHVQPMMAIRVSAGLARALQVLPTVTCSAAGYLEISGSAVMS